MVSVLKKPNLPVAFSDPLYSVRDLSHELQRGRGNAQHEAQQQSLTIILGSCFARPDLPLYCPINVHSSLLACVASVFGLQLE